MLFEETLKLEPVAFCYWLQGAIEIGELTTFTSEHVLLIGNVLEAIVTHNVFTVQCLILLKGLPPEIAFVHINSELQQIFIHDIDNSYEGDQEFLHLVHTGKEKVLEA